MKTNWYFILLFSTTYLSNIDPSFSQAPDLIIEDGRIQFINPGGSVYVGEGSGMNIIDWQSIKCNTGVGHRSLFNNSFGSNNTAIGGQSMFFNEDGNLNTAIGCKSLYSNISGNSNVAVGFEALNLNQSLSANTAVGYHALSQHFLEEDVANPETYNTAVGYEAMYGIETALEKPARENTAIGNHALFKNGGNGNSAVGSGALGSCQEGNFNTAAGARALVGNTDGNYNTGIGYRVLSQNTTGSFNTAVGHSAVRRSTGDHNTALGSHAGKDRNGSYNTFFGNQLQTTTDDTAGTHNSWFGAFASTFGDATYNTILIGVGSRTRVSHRAKIGNPTVTSIGGPVDWSVVSDAQFKKEVLEDVPGVDFITALRPVTYLVDHQAIANWWQANYPEDPLDTLDLLPDTSFIRYSGLLAQEVETVAQNLKYEFSGVDAPGSETETYGLRYATLTVPLVKAVQEIASSVQEFQEATVEITMEIGQISLESKRLLDQKKQQWITGEAQLKRANNLTSMMEEIRGESQRTTIRDSKIGGND